MLNISTSTIPDWHGFHIHPGAVYGNIMGVYYVYFGERSKNTIKVWTRAKSAHNGSTEWHKLLLTPEHKRWNDFDSIAVSVDYTQAEAKRTLRQEQKQQRQKQQAEQSAYNRAEQLIKSVSTLDRVAAPSYKDEVYHCTRSRREKVMYSTTTTIRNFSDFHSTEVAVLKKGTIMYRNGK